MGAFAAAVPMTWEDVHRLATEAPLAPDAGVLVIVTLYGGNDGINTVIPYTQDAYYAARPDLAYAAEDVVDLDGEFGLNPGMQGLGKLFHDGSLAIVRGVGYPDQDRSHFRSMDIWQTGTVDNSVATGWIGRWLDLQGQNSDPLRAVNVGSVLPTLAIGSHSTAATVLLDTSTRKDHHLDVLSALAEPDSEDNGTMSTVRNSYRAAASATRQLDDLLSGQSKPSASAEGASEERLASQLDMVSGCIRAGLSTQVYTVSLSGFDTHADEKSTQQSLLKSVDTALTKFLKEMASHERGRNVVVAVYSEFGRRVAANASDGTDHGTSGPVLIAGTPVRGGFYGDDPSLTDLAGDDLKTTTDFRDVYAELLSTTLGADPDPIVGAKRKPLGFLA